MRCGAPELHGGAGGRRGGGCGENQFAPAYSSSSSSSSSSFCRAASFLHHVPLSHSHHPAPSPCSTFPTLRPLPPALHAESGVVLDGNDSELAQDLSGRTLGAVRAGSPPPFLARAHPAAPAARCLARPPTAGPNKPSKFASPCATLVRAIPRTVLGFLFLDRDGPRTSVDAVRFGAGWRTGAGGEY